MREDWVCSKLEDTCEVMYGNRVIKKRDAGTIYPVYGGGGETFRIDQYNREDCTIVSRFGMSAECVRHVAGKFFLNDSGLSVRPKVNSGLICRFLDYLLFSMQGTIFSLGRGSAQKNLDVKAFRKLDIVYPKDRQEQKRIVAILDEAFAGIETAIANTEKNLANARELFESYLNAVFTRPGQEWRTMKLGDVCDFLNGFAFKSQDAVGESDVQLIRMGNLYKNELNLERKPCFYPSSYAKRFSRYVLSEGDLIMSLTGTVDKEDYGYTVEVPRVERILLLNQRIAKFENIRDDLVGRMYLLHYLRSRSFLDRLYASARGVRQANLSSVSMKKLPIAFPKIAEQEKLIEKFNGLEGDVKSMESLYQQKLTALAELKQSLLQKAFSGELTTEAEKTENEVKEAMA